MQARQMGSGSAQAARKRAGTTPQPHQVAAGTEMFKMPQSVPIQDVETVEQLRDCTNALSAESEGQRLCAIDAEWEVRLCKHPSLLTSVVL